MIEIYLLIAYSVIALLMYGVLVGYDDVNFIDVGVPIALLWPLSLLVILGIVIGRWIAND